MSRYLLGVRGTLGEGSVFFYCICAVIRLAFFNVLEAKRQQVEGGGNKTYRGLPVTSIAFVLPLAFWLQFILPELAFMVLLHLILLIVGFLFIYDFPLRKPSLKTLLFLIGFVAVTVGIIFAFTKFKVPNSDVKTSPIVDGFMEEINETDPTEWTGD
jgi:CDP-diacylglycerol--serine O-phosphatidyltransferase